MTTSDRLRAVGGWAEDRILRRLRPPYGPRNVVSNAGYFIAGTYLPARYQDDSSAVMGVMLWVLGTGSALYHAEKHPEAQATDWVGMLAVLAATAVLAWLAVPIAMLAAAGLVVGWYLMRLRGTDGNVRAHRVPVDWLVGALLASAVIGIWLKGDRATLGVSLAVYLVAFGIWHMDKRPSPITGRWGHALWHVLTSVAMVLMYQAAR